MMSDSARATEVQTNHGVNVVAVRGPASLSNLGPGFDTLGLAVEELGDVVEAWPREEPGVAVQAHSDSIADVPMAPSANTAAVAAQAVLDKLRAPMGVVLRIRKGLPIGSGLGSSAASAVAGAWAAHRVLGAPLGKADLVDAVLAGEAVASGCRHGDNVLPALFGGMVLTHPERPTDYRRIPLPKPLPLALVLPHVQVLTQQARALLPDQVPLVDAVRNGADLAFLLDAVRAGDWEAMGRQIMTDRLVEPVRAQLVPCYAAVRRAALEADALGCALTGSGPALFAVARSADHAAAVAETMVQACRASGIEATGVATAADTQGVRAL
jgi:homoserine kinase